MQTVWRETETQAGRLLRVLFLWQQALSPEASCIEL
jgi:hypothetical protein